MLSVWLRCLGYLESSIIAGYSTVTRFQREVNRQEHDTTVKEVFLSIKFEVRHFLQMRMNILQWCSIPKSFAWARI